MARVFETGGVWGDGDNTAVKNKGWVTVREQDHRVQVQVPDGHTPLLTPDAALHLSRQLRRIALRIKRATEDQA